MHPFTEFGVASSKFTFTGGPHVKKVFRLWRVATCTPQKWHPQWILSRHSLHVTCAFGISGASRLTCRCVRILECANHLRVHCTCTMHPSPLKHTAPSRPCQGAPMYRVWCRWAQSSLSPEDPTSKQLLHAWRVQLAPHRNGTPNGF